MNDVVFVKFQYFDNGKAVRELPYGGIHAWAVRKDDLDHFCDTYADGIPLIVTPSPEATIYALDYQDADRYVIGESDCVPELEAFEWRSHAVQARIETRYCHCGCGEKDGDYTAYNNPYQVIIQGEARTHKYYLTRSCLLRGLGRKWTFELDKDRSVDLKPPMIDGKDRMPNLTVKMSGYNNMLRVHFSYTIEQKGSFGYTERYRITERYYATETKEGSNIFDIDDDPPIIDKERK